MIDLHYNLYFWKSPCWGDGVIMQWVQPWNHKDRCAQISLYVVHNLWGGESLKVQSKKCNEPVSVRDTAWTSTGMSGCRNDGSLMFLRARKKILSCDVGCLNQKTICKYFLIYFILFNLILCQNSKRRSWRKLEVVICPMSSVFPVSI